MMGLDRVVSQGNRLWPLLSEIYEDSEWQRNNLHKLVAMQEVFLARNKERFNSTEIDTIKLKLGAVIDKFLMASFWLEQTWVLSHSHRKRSFVSGQEIRLDTAQLFILRSYLDAFLFESRAYVDLLMLYILLITLIAR